MGEPQNRSREVLAVNILFFVSTWISTSLRVYVRSIMIKSYGADDWAMCGVVLLYTAYLACQLGGVAHGTGQHRSALTDANAQIALRFWFLCEFFYSLSTSFLKVAVGFFLLRITVERIHILIIRLIMLCSACIGVFYCLLVLFQCKPVSYWWDLDPDHKGKCLSPLAMVETTYLVSALNAVADWAFAILPIFIVKNLQMKKHTKIVVAVILGLAAMGSTATIIRIPYIGTLEHYKGEFLYNTTDVAIWTTVEVGIGITAANFATLRPIFQQFLILVGLQSSSAGESEQKWTTHRRTGATGASKLDHRSHVLNDLNPTADPSKTLTTVTITAEPSSSHHHGSWLHETESEEMLAGPSESDSTALKGTGGINKSVSITTVEERTNRIRTPDEESGMCRPAIIYEGV